MKRILIRTVLVSVVICLFMMPEVFAESSEASYNTIDMIRIIQHRTAQELVPEWERYRYDMDYDGGIDIIDVILLKKKLLEDAEKADLEPVEEKIIELLNNNRIQNGKPKAAISGGLCKAADIRAQELAMNNFSSSRPNGATLDSLFAENGVNIIWYSWVYSAVSETAEDVYNDIQYFKTSSFDSTEYNKIGVGHYYDPSSPYGHYWVVFIGR